MTDRVAWLTPGLSVIRTVAVVLPWPSSVSGWLSDTSGPAPRSYVRYASLHSSSLVMTKSNSRSEVSGSASSSFVRQPGSGLSSTSHLPRSRLISQVSQRTRTWSSPIVASIHTSVEPTCSSTLENSTVPSKLSPTICGFCGSPSGWPSNMRVTSSSSVSPRVLATKFVWKPGLCANALGSSPAVRSAGQTLANSLKLCWIWIWQVISGAGGSMVSPVVVPSSSVPATSPSSVSSPPMASSPSVVSVNPTSGSTGQSSPEQPAQPERRAPPTKMIVTR